MYKSKQNCIQILSKIVVKLLQYTILANDILTF